MPSDPQFEQLVELHYRDLYRFAFSLTHSRFDASDLTQQTFYIWASKGRQLRDVSRVKSWLFTTLHREFLQSRRREIRFQHYELSEMETELPTISPGTIEAMDANQAVDLLGQLDEMYRAPLSLFYLEDISYKEIADILEIPLGTVQSRISRGKAHLYRLLSEEPRPKEKTQNE